MYQLNVPLTDNQIEALRVASKRDHRTLSSYVREALSKGLPDDLKQLFNQEG